VATGLTRATVSALADRLIMAALVTELPPVMSQRAGRPAVPLVPAAGTLAAAGMEVNVDYLGVRVVDLAGAVLGQGIESVDLRGSDPAVVMRRLSEIYCEVTGRLGPELRMVGSALAIPGIVDRVIGPVRLAPNLGWRDVDVVEEFHSHSETSQVPIRLDNEATLGARAEADALRRAGVLSFLYLSGEVGVGGALVVDGSVFGGRHGWSGEIGHTVVDPAGPLCRCGATGCLEQYAGKDALMRSAAMDLDLPVDYLARAAESGDAAALRSLTDAAGALGTALANAINLIDVENVVLGGIYAPLAQFLIPGIDAVLQARVLSAPWSSLHLRTAEVTDYAAMTGAASLVLSDVIDDPSPWLDN
jgi:predicted NBD/HSP70 family sugar kinase